MGPSVDPRHRPARSAHSVRTASDDPSARVSAAQTLERFQLFHTPPATPIARQEQARKDDARIDARWLEYQRTDLPKREDIARQLDFHQIVAAMGSYPTLLRRLGPRRRSASSRQRASRRRPRRTCR